MATGFLKVDGNRVVDEKGEPVMLRGTAVGGWMKYCPRAYGEWT